MSQVKDPTPENEPELQKLYDEGKARESTPESREAGFMQPRRIQVQWVGGNWRSAFYKAMLATVLLLLVVLLFFKGSAGAIGAFPIVLGLYTVVSYYTDKVLYDRRQRKKAREGKAQAR